MVSLARKRRRGDDGLSLVELMLTAVLACIVFAGMVPLFANALKTTAQDDLRVTASNVAQQKIEQVREIMALPSAFPSIDASYLETQLGTSETPSDAARPCQIAYGVVDHTTFKTVTVTVSWVGETYKTKMSTLIVDPKATSTASTSGSPSPSPSPSSTTGFYTLTANVSDSNVVTIGMYKGCTCVRTDVIPNQTCTPAIQYPTRSSPAVWSGLAGGPNAQYLVTVYCKPRNKVLTLTYSVNLTSDYSFLFDTTP